MFQISEVLKKVPFFKTLGKNGIDFIVERLKFKTFEADETICQIGDPGDKMYIIISGEVNVVVRAKDSDKETVIATLSSGDYFGEMSLLTGEPRSATVVTTQPSEMFILNKADFDIIVERFPSITLSMGKIMSQRLRDTLQKAAGAAASASAPAAVKGSLSDKPLIEVLRFCESNSLNGKLVVSHGAETATLHFLRGELQKVELGDMDETEAMDTMLNWNEGDFSIEPEPLKLEEEAPPSKPEISDLLIINNSVVVQKMLQRTFEKIGYTVYTVETLQKGLNMIEKLKPDAVISDIKLPDASANELVSEIRKISSVPVVLLTDQRSSEKLAAELEGTDKIYFTKSQEMGAILNTVEKISG